LKRSLEILASAWFSEKRFIVPSRQSERFVRRFSSRVLYFPQLWSGPKARPLPSRSGKPRVLFVGLCSDWKKNVPLLLRSIASRPDLVERVGLCGRMGDLDLTPFTTVLGSQLVVHGEVSREQLSAIYRSYDVLVLPSIVDPIGAVVLEAMAHGLPVIVSHTVGASSYVDDGVTGFVIEPSQQGILAALIRIQRWQTRQKMSKAAATKVNAQHWIGNDELRDCLYADFIAFATRNS
jgi:glycosyltransferase involved in cell wall biosynthesis